jgi:cytochrome P450
MTLDNSLDTRRPEGNALAEQPNFDTVSPPPHVPEDHIIDFDYFHPEGVPANDLYEALKRLHAAPDITWTARNGGHWIATRSDDIRWMRNAHEIFSHEEMAIPRGSMNTPMPPINVDPPMHARYRAVLNPAFTPTAVQSLVGKARDVAVELIEQLKPHGSCEFVTEFARVMPVVVFLSVVDLPTDRRAEFVSWASDYTTATDQETKDRGAAAVANFLAGVLDQREANPGTDLLSRIAAWRKNPRFQHEGEVMGMAMVSFIGGLDTVANMISFTARHLATHPEARRRLIDNPELIPKAAEEYIRRHGLTMTSRLIKQDVTHKGVTMKRDDMVLLIDPLAGIDERAYPDPMTVDFDRDTRVHDTFGNGAHKCVGEHLARREVAVFIEEWLKRIPDFRLDPAKPPRSYGGAVVGMSQLGLRWD